MSRILVRLAFIVIVALAAFGAWWLWLREPPPPATTPPARLYVAEQSDVAGLEVTADGATMAFERGGEGWHFVHNPRVPVNLDRWGGIVLLLSGPRIEGTIPATDDLGTYGLAEPSTVIDVALDGGNEVVVRLGDITPDGQHYYARVGGQDEIALVNEPWGNALRRLATVPPYPYWHYRVDPSLVRIFEVERDGEAVTFLLGLPAEGASANRVVRDDVARDMTEAEVTKLLAIVGGPPALRVRDRPLPPDPVDPDFAIRVSYELAEPLETRSTYSAVYRIDDRDSGGDYLATTEDTENVLEFDAAWVETVVGLLATTVE